MRPELSRAVQSGIWKKVLRAAIIGSAVTVLLLMLCAWAVWRGTVPESVMSDLVLGAAFAGAIASGAAAAGEGRGLVCGVLGGFGYLAAASVVGFYREQGGYFDTDYIKLAICAFAGGGFGGIISTGKKTKKKFSKKRRYTNSNHSI